MLYYLGKGTEFKKEDCKEYKTIEVPFHPVFTRYAFALLAFIFLNELFSIFCRMKLKKCLSKTC